MNTHQPRQRAPGQRRQKRGMSLRTRLVAVAATLVAFAVFATGTAAYLMLRKSLSGQLNSNLAAVAASVGPHGFRGDPGGGLGNYETAPRSAIVHHNGQVTPYALNSRPLQITAEQAAEVITANGKYVDLTTQTGEDVRVVDVGNFGITSESDINEPVVVLAALSLAPMQRTLNGLLGVDVVAGLIAIVGTVVLGTYGVQLGLRPLKRVTRTARTVAAELGPDGTGLQRRVPAGNRTTEVGQLAEAVNTMLNAVEREYSARYESEQRMRRFLADASHELRTPLTSLRGYAELIRMRGGAGFDDDAQDSLRRIESEGTRMSRLVDDLLTLARHDRGVVAERKPVELGAVVSDAVAGLRAAHPERQITMRSPGPVTVLGDRDQLQQVVMNLLNNAAVHTRPEGPITVEVGQHGGAAAITVADSGPGLSADQVAQMFERFWRADTGRTRARGGSGLGLSIVQALVTTHGGDVAVESSPDAGTTITVRLPVAVPMASGTLASGRIPAALLPAQSPNPSPVSGRGNAAAGR